MFSTLGALNYTGAGTLQGGPDPFGCKSKNGADNGNMMQMLYQLGEQLGLQFRQNGMGSNQNAFSTFQNPGFGAVGQPAAGPAAPQTAPPQNGAVQGKAGKEGEKGKEEKGIGGFLGRIKDSFSGLTSLAKNIISGQGLPIGSSVMVAVLQGVAGLTIKDPEQRKDIMGALKEVQNGKPLEQCMSSLSDEEKTKLCDTIGTFAFGMFKPPECLRSYASDPSYFDGPKFDCALRNVEVSESEGYSHSQVGKLTAPLELFRKGLSSFC